MRLPHQLPSRGSNTGNAICVCLTAVGKHISNFTLKPTQATLVLVIPGSLGCERLWVTAQHHVILSLLGVI